MSGIYLGKNITVYRKKKFMNIQGGRWVWSFTVVCRLAALILVASGIAALDFDHRFSERIAHFIAKNLQIGHGRSFLVSDLRDSLKSLTKKEGMSESLDFLKIVQNFF